MTDDLAGVAVVHAGSPAASARDAAPSDSTPLPGDAVAGATRPTLRLGTRGSALALAQSGAIAEALRERGASVEIVTIRTAGDNRPPSTVWGEGAFVTALEAALLDGRIDVAVHSAKDVPTTQDARLRIAAFPPREDPRDALVTTDPSLTLDTLPRGARIGTDSPRRVAFLLARRPDLRPHPLHGNVDTRLRRLADGESDALVLAVAGLTRLGLAGRITQALPADVIPPAPGQGALAIQCRADDPIAGPLVELLDDPATRAAVEAERAFLAASGGGCRSPLGALGTVRDGTLELLVGAADPAGVPAGDAPATAAAEAPGTTFTAPESRDGQVRVAWARGSSSANEGLALAEALAREIGAVIERRAVARPAVRRAVARLAVARPAVARPAVARRGAARPTVARPASTRRPRVLVTRDPERAGPLVDALRAKGLEPIHIPTISIDAGRPGGPLDGAVPAAAGYAWVVVTSAAGADALGAAARRRGVDLGSSRVASVGAATTAAIERAGGQAAFEPGIPTAAALAEELPIVAGDRVMIVRGDLADGRLGDRLRARGAVVDEVIAYRTIEGPPASASALRAAIAAGLDGLIFTSGSTVRGLLALLDGTDRVAVLDVPAFCIGPSSAAVARDAGFAAVREASAPDPGTLAELVRTRLAGSAGATDERPLVTITGEVS